MSVLEYKLLVLGAVTIIVIVASYILENVAGGAWYVTATIAVMTMIIGAALMIPQVTYYRQEDYDLAKIDAETDYSNVYAIKRSESDVETDGDFYLRLSQYYFGIEELDKYELTEEETKETKETKEAEETSESTEALLEKYRND